MTTTRPAHPVRAHLPRTWSPITGSSDPAVNRGLLRLGRAVYRARGRAGLSQRSLASRCGVDQPTISRLERGKQSGISLRRLALILAVLDDVVVDDRREPRA